MSVIKHSFEFSVFVPKLLSEEKHWVDFFLSLALLPRKSLRRSGVGVIIFSKCLPLIPVCMKGWLSSCTHILVLLGEWVRTDP